MVDVGVGPVGERTVGSVPSGNELMIHSRVILIYVAAPDVHSVRFDTVVDVAVLNTGSSPYRRVGIVGFHGFERHTSLHGHDAVFELSACDETLGLSRQCGQHGAER